MSAETPQKKEGCNTMSENERLDQVPEEEASGVPAAEPAGETKSKPAKPKKDKEKGKKAKDKKKKGNRIARWFREMKSELKKVQWPTFKEVLKNTGTVILCVLVVGIFIWVFDLLAHAIINALLKLF